MWSLIRTPAGRPAGTPAIVVDPRKFDRCIGRLET